MILAGDVGGTKTILALISMERGVEDPVREERFPSGKYESLEAIVAEFLKDSDVTLDAASFGVCGPVVGGEAHITNLPWVIRADTIEKAFGIPKVNILNDLQAIATAIPHQRADEIHTLNDGQRDPTGTIGVIAPGTGLGEAFMVWTGSRYLACATEGGHASFGPVTHEQVKLLSYLEPRFGHVSYERVCSGSAIPNLYDYLRSQRLYEEPDWLREELAAAKDRTPIIMNAACLCASSAASWATWRSGCSPPAASISAAASRPAFCPGWKNRTSSRRFAPRAGSAAGFRGFPCMSSSTPRWRCTAPRGTGWKASGVDAGSHRRSGWCRVADHPGIAGGRRNGSLISKTLRNTRCAFEFP